MKPLAWIFLVLLPAVVCAGNYSETRNLALPAAGVIVMRVQNGAGRMTLQGAADADVIDVVAEIKTKGADKEEFQLLVDKFLQLDLKREYNRALLVGDAKPLPLTDIEVQINLDIQLPANMNVRIIDGSGAVVVRNIVGDLIIDDNSGLIWVGNVKGRVQIEDGSGDIEIENVQGNLQIVDGSGQMVIQHVTGDVTITDASGGIEINDIGGSVTVSDGSGSIDIYRVKKNVFIREPGSGELDIDGVQGKVIIRE